MTSFLENRKIYVSLETFDSQVIYQGSWGYCQGSKFAGLIYTIYTNEIPLIKNVMDNPDSYLKITGSTLPINTNNDM